MGFVYCLLSLGHAVVDCRLSADTQLNMAGVFWLVSGLALVVAVYWLIALFFPERF